MIKKNKKLTYRVIKFEQLIFSLGEWEQCSPTGSFLAYSPRNSFSTVTVVLANGMTEGYKCTSGFVVWVCGDLVHLPPT